jgi:hypothetical protein
MDTCSQALEVATECHCSLQTAFTCFLLCPLPLLQLQQEMAAAKCELRQGSGGIGGGFGGPSSGADGAGLPSTQQLTAALGGGSPSKFGARQQAAARLDRAMRLAQVLPR